MSRETAKRGVISYAGVAASLTTTTRGGLLYFGRDAAWLWMTDSHYCNNPHHPNYGQRARTAWASTVATTSHKLIGFGYMLLGVLMGVVAFALSELMRLELGYAGLVMSRYARMVLEYNVLISTHGIVMLFGFVMPLGFAALGNLLLPMELGVMELAFPRLNILSLWLIVAGLSTYALGALVQVGGLNAGWTFYPPLVTRDADALGVATDLMLLSMHALGLSSAFGGINFVVTMRVYRHECEDALGVSLYGWSLTVTALLLTLALPMLALAVTGVLLDRSMMTLVFDGQLGGDPLMFQHLFWFFGHPEVYIIMLPVFGLVSVVLAMLDRAPILGDEGMVYCMMAIGWIGFVVWGHHMFVVGMDVDSRLYFSIATSVIAIPTAVKVFTYATSWYASPALVNSSLAFIFHCFLASFLLGGLSGLLLSSSTFDLFFHDTYFVVGHFHTVLSLATVFGLLFAMDGLRALWSGLALCESRHMFYPLLLLFGAVCVFGPMHTNGLHGMTRRVPESPDVYMPAMALSTYGAWVLLAAVLYYVRLQYYAATSRCVHSWFTSPYVVTRCVIELCSSTRRVA